ncbi:uncharacterized protein LOC119720033 [Patiria miniata]|uniref:Uncharacterized protein n=1 Tax=Patiria miniata TaxID=46514 RepID=A0A913Z1C2_PATMI|nr:uncharacterized protein LOC119720033 [Patiria miniata]
MLATALLCLMAVGGVNANYAEKNGLSSKGLSFSVMSLECGETHCAKCYVDPGSDGNVYLNTFEVTKKPNKYQLNVEGGTHDWMVEIVQEDRWEPFRVCRESTGADAGITWTWNMCFEDFTSSGLTIPEECGEPVALYYSSVIMNDDSILGQQVLFCTKTIGDLR